ncbi:MAG: hypothetical protein ACHQX0_05130 [Desulfobaccales bacterium]
MVGPLVILACILLVVGYSLVYTGASIGTSWQTDFRSALLGGLKFAGAAA